MKLLFLGDIVGNAGRTAVKELIKSVQKQYLPDFIFANAENSAGGYGCNLKTYEMLLSYGITLMTSGNHIFDQKEFVKEIDELDKIIRPYNYPPGNPGLGYKIIQKDNTKICVLNLLGRVFLSTVDCPFRKADEIIDIMEKKGIKNIIVDFHSEATSEKLALAFYLDSRVTAVLGTHTHVPTADERILSGGCAYITDIGMCGEYNTILGFEKEPIMEKFLTQAKRKVEVSILIVLDNFSVTRNTQYTAAIAVSIHAPARNATG